MFEKAVRKESLFKVMNPAGVERPVTPLPLSTRLPDLNGKVVYCISQYIGGSDIFVQKVAEVLPRYVGKIKSIYRKKPANYQIDDPELWDEIEEKADAVIYGCGA